jgi:hypothetical protein
MARFVRPAPAALLVTAQAGLSARQTALTRRSGGFGKNDLATIS